MSRETKGDQIVANTKEFGDRIEAREPVFIDKLTPEKLELELAKGYKAIEEGRVHSADEVDAILKRDLGV